MSDGYGDSDDQADDHEFDEEADFDEDDEEAHHIYSYSLSYIPFLVTQSLIRR